MRLYEFETSDETTRQIDELAKTIVRECKPILNLLKFPTRNSSGTPYLLYRGVAQNDLPPNPSTQIMVRKNRMPLDTPPTASKIVDDWLLNNITHSWKPRSEALFALSSPAQTGVYGTPCVIFPIGNFDYLWSTEIKDMYDAVVNVIGGKKAEITPEKEEKLKEMLRSVKWKLNTNFSEFMATANSTSDTTELMINVNSYYAIPVSDNYINRSNFIPALERAMFDSTRTKLR